MSKKRVLVDADRKRGVGGRVEDGGPRGAHGEAVWGGCKVGSQDCLQISKSEALCSEGALSSRRRELDNAESVS